MKGFPIDDPMLALIARFAGCCDDMQVSEEAFLRAQLLRVREYVEGYPADHRQERALAWITRNAERYRLSWSKEQVADRAVSSRCPDCPLERSDEATTCAIHERWLALLNDYVAGDTSSRVYVEETLALLQQYKDRLRRSVARVAHDP